MNNIDNEIDKNENEISDYQDSVEAQKKKKSTAFNHIWWIPFIALLIVIYLAVNHYTSQGPLVTIQFDSAGGIEVGKTKVRYKDVDIGKVEKIQLSDNHKGVLISVRMQRDTDNLLREKTSFWIVKPRVTLTQVTGLNTLLSGNYITLDPDKDKTHEHRYEFAGLSSPPIITQDKPGLRLTLRTSKANSLSPGTAIYYKGLPVGSVDRVYFSEDYDWVKADIFIASPHDKLIKNNTKFWSASSIAVDLGTSGLDIEIESVETLVAGGIVFDNPVSLKKETQASAGSEYILYKNKKSAFEQDYGKSRYFVTYFNSSVKGLAANSPVSFQGITVGKVKDIRLLFDKSTQKTYIPVLFEVYENRLGIIDTHKTTNQEGTVDKKTNELPIDITQVLVQQGLHTQIETANLLTGAKNIALTFKKEKSPNTLQKIETDPITGYTLLPSTPESFDAIAASATSLMDKVNKLPLNEIATNLNELLSSTNNTLNGLKLQQTIKTLNNFLKGGHRVTTNARHTLNSLDKNMTTIVKSAEKTLAGFSPDAPLYYNMTNTLSELNETLESLRRVTDMLDRKSNALIFGEGNQ